MPITCLLIADRPARRPAKLVRAFLPHSPIRTAIGRWFFVREDPGGSSVDFFKGDPEHIQDFLRQLRLRFLQQPVKYSTERAKVMFTLGQLRGTAADWSDAHVKQIGQNELPAGLTTFDSLAEKLHQQFGDPLLAERNEQKIMTLRQTSTVRDYTAEFRRLLVSLPARWDDAALRPWYKRGLKESIQNAFIGGPQATSLAELIKQVFEVEEQIWLMNNSRVSPVTRADTSLTRFFDPQKRRCYTCGEKGHVQANCPIHKPPERAPTSAAASAAAGKSHAAVGPTTAEPRKCFQCGSTSHLKWQCPTLRGGGAGGAGGAAGAGSAASGGLGRPPKTVAAVTTPGTDKTPLIAHVTVRFLYGEVETTALLDTGSSVSLIDQEFAYEQGALECYDVPLWLSFADGTMDKKRKLTKSTTVGLHARGLHTMGMEDTKFYLTKIGPTPIILGMDWLTKNRVHIDCASRQCTIGELDGLQPDSGDGDEPQPNGCERPQPADETTSAVQDRIPAVLRPYAEIFTDRQATALPPHRTGDMAIELQPGAMPPLARLRPQSAQQAEATRVYIQDMLDKQFIRPSKSPCGANLIFVKQKDKMRPCVDYRGLNDITISNRYPLPRIDDMLSRLGKAVVFTKLDLKGAFNLVRIREGDEWKTAFRTQNGMFEFRVMPFGLKNAPAVFQAFVNSIFSDMLDVCVQIYIDDILIFSDSEELHKMHLDEVGRRLQENGLAVNLEKCIFQATEVPFLGHIVSTRGIAMDEEKIAAIRDWPVPKTTLQVQKLLGFAGYYRGFIANYSETVQPLSDLLKKGAPFVWGETQSHATTALLQAMQQAPILAHFDARRSCTLETDASDIGIGAVLSQRQLDGELHPVAYFSRKLDQAERNYSTTDKEMLAIVASFKHWRQYLLGAEGSTTVITDHKNLLGWRARPVDSDNKRQSRWREILEDFEHTIVYRPGTENGRADALSRRADYEEQEPFEAVACAITRQYSTNDDLTAQIAVAQKADPKTKAVLDWIQNDREGPIPKTLRADECTAVDGLLRAARQIYVPDDNSIKLEVLKRCHDAVTAGHFGVTKTVDLVTRSFYWPGVHDTVAEYIATCEACQRAKTTKRGKWGELQQLPVPAAPWVDISLDSIVKLPQSGDFDSIFVVVDRLTKMAHFVPCSEKMDAEQFASLFVRDVARLHGMPRSIVSDRGSIFLSKFWTRTCYLWGVSLKQSSAYHPQTDGQTERTNQIVEQHLRLFTSYGQDDWADLLPMAEYAYNNAKQESIGMSPFKALYGKDVGWTAADDAAAAADVVPAADNRVNELQELQELLRTNLERARERQKAQYDKDHAAAPLFKEGDLVWLRTDNLRTRRPCKKFDDKRVGPFKVEKRINDVTYKLQLPETMRVHNVFHVSLLDKVKDVTSKLRGDEEQPGTAPVVADAEPMFEVQDIVDSRLVDGRLQYKIDWAGFSEAEQSWEPAEAVEHLSLLVAAFHQKYPEKPRRRKKGKEKAAAASA